MNSFTIRDIENLCGIKAHTLRIWEQRYQLVNPRRKAGNHRLYDNDDLKYLLRIAYLYHNGHKISKLAGLSEDEVRQLTLSLVSANGSVEIFVNHLMEASLDFDQERFDKILHNIILHMGFRKAITQVAYPFLNKIGLLWLTGHLVPAQEHFASALIIRKILVAINGLDNPLPGGGRQVLIYAPKGEFHEIPLLYMRYLMKRKGTHTIYFGTDIDIDELTCYCQQKSVSHLYFHLVTNLLRCEPDVYVQQLRETFPEQQIVLSGALAGTLQHIPPRVQVLKSLEEMQTFAEED